MTVETVVPSSSVRPATVHVASLVDQLETERRLLGDLRRVLLSQREGISNNDLVAIDESTFSAQRVLLTLQQARQRRRSLLEILEVDLGGELEALEDALGELATDDLVASRDALLADAAELARELTLNSRVIDGALDIGDRLLRAFTGQTERPNLYKKGDAGEPSGASGILLNTRI